MKELSQSIFTGMPSLLSDNQQLTFNCDWPRFRELPVPQAIMTKRISIKQGNEIKYITIPLNYSSGKRQKKSKRTKKLAWNCEHVKLINYAKGVCQKCYLALYYNCKKSKSN